MSQRLGIAAALLGDPPVLLFDEPVNGLDPEGIRWVRTLMRTLAGEGRTVFVSSHLLAEMSNTADRLVVIGRGKLIASTTVSEFVGRADTVRVRSPQLDLLRQVLTEAGIDGRRRRRRPRRCWCAGRPARSSVSWPRATESPCTS